MKKVFSFSLFGTKEKYWRGMYKNIELIHQFFPEWYIYIWVGDEVFEDVIIKLSEQKNVKLIPTEQSGLINMSFRFFSIDHSDVDVMVVRDADSRVNERDKACIEDFVNSDKLFHIIRDHPNHHHPIMGGMWGIKKEYLNVKLYELFNRWREKNNATQFWNDMDFLRDIFYPHVLPFAMIHDELQSFEPLAWRTPFRIPLDEKKQHFIGQVYEFDKEGNEIPMCLFVKG